MQPQDIYNRDFDAQTAELDRWLSTLVDVARVDCEMQQNFWRARLEPHAANTCPVELMISRGQTFDIDVGPESLAEQRVTTFKLFLPLLQAIADGHVVRRSWSAEATRVALKRELIVHLADGRDWAIRRVVSAGTAATEATAIATDHAYLPYRR